VFDARGAHFGQRGQVRIGAVSLKGVEVGKTDDVNLAHRGLFIHHDGALDPALIARHDAGRLRLICPELFQRTAARGEDGDYHQANVYGIRRQWSYLILRTLSVMRRMHRSEVGEWTYRKLSSRF